MYYVVARTLAFVALNRFLTVSIYGNSSPPNHWSVAGKAHESRKWLPAMTDSTQELDINTSYEVHSVDRIGPSSPLNKVVVQLHRVGGMSIVPNEGKLVTILSPKTNASGGLKCSGVQNLNP